jgi:hypothetical protein
VVDTRATDHVCFNTQGFKITQHLSGSEIVITLGDATRVAVIAVGDVHLLFDNRVLEMFFMFQVLERIQFQFLSCFEWIFSFF